MTDSTDGIGSTGGGADPHPVSQPLPPEVPAPRTEPPPPGPAGLDGPDPAVDTDPEPWWRAPATDVPEWAAAADEPAPDEAPGVPGQVPWPGSDADPAGMEGIVAAHEIGAQIGEAISAHLPGPQVPSKKLDLRWLRLKYNIPGLALAVLVTWSGRSGMDRMTAVVAEDGIFAPLGALLLVVLVGLAVMVLPVGSWLGAALGHLVSAVTVGLVRLVRRAWTTPYVGYVLRVVVAVVVWSFVLAVGRVVWRSAVHFLTGA
ncbi:hypothetical protein [Streptomyces sp. NPDC056045]|uniref:hypothetical protein n=1 Tax=Streptomyces sp. NPDC056045 TaxID=3345691 RepID=UPI0035E338BF